MAFARAEPWSPGRVAFAAAAFATAACVACSSILGLDETELRAVDAGAADGAADAGTSGGGETRGLSVEPATLVVRRGETRDLRVAYGRPSGDEEPVRITLSGLPTGVGAPSVVLARAVSEALVPVSAGLFAAYGPSSLTVSVDREGATRDVTLLVAGPSGTLDETFDGDGVASVSSVSIAPSLARVQALAADPSGGTVVGGVRAAAPDGGTATRAGWLVARLDAAGALDAAFEQSLPALPDSGEVSAIVVSASGKVVVVGSSTVDGGVPQLTAIRLLASGALDDAFGEGGIVRLSTLEAETGARAYAVAIAPDESVAVVGSRGAVGTEDGLVVRLGPNGRPDAMFASGKPVVVPDSRLVGVGHAASGGLLVAGTEKPNALSRLFVTRHLADGRVDATFGTGGTSRLGVTYRATGSILLANGEVVLVGGAPGGAETPFTAALVTGTGAAGFARGFAPEPGASFYSAAASGPASFVAAGHAATGGGRVARIWTDGGVDDAFGQGGFSVLDPAAPDDGVDLTLFAVTTLADGRILVGGHRTDVGPVVMRLWP